MIDRENKTAFILPTIIIISVVFIILAVSVIAGVNNYRNRISEGWVVDKQMSAGYMYYSAGEKDASMYSRTSTYYLEIEGEKNGKKVSFWKEVSEEEYHEYSVGDWYGRAKGGETWK